jgi:serine/threonine protein kinase HipA of HipAB toxin-antitoxin module
MSLDASSSAWPGATSAPQRRDVIDAHLAAGRRRHRQPPDGADVAPLILEDTDLHRILLAALAVGRNLIVAGDHQPQRAADRRDPDAEIRRAGAVDRDLHLRARVGERGLHVDHARQPLRLGEQLL